MTTRADELRERTRWHFELLATQELPAEIIADVKKECHAAEMEAWELDEQNKKAAT